MPLNTAHEGYEYQDLLTAFFILEEILNENLSVFKIDNKEHADDKFDDLTIQNPNGVFKKQIKYSNELTNHTATKDDFATSNNYDLALYDLFKSWNVNRTYNYRICLAWNEPIDKLKDFIQVSPQPKTFKSGNTKVFKINIDKLWPNGSPPESSWQKFRAKSSTINRDDFETFCNELIIETNFPKQSSDASFLGELETIIISQITNLGIGTYPNTHHNVKSFALELLKLITRSRSRGFEISTKDIFGKLNIKTDFGSIEQVFPIDNQKNINTENNIKSLVSHLENSNKVILKGEPGSGKSWFVQNLQSELSKKDYNIVRHYCYTELKDKFSKERITLNVFYGNLIKDILDTYPYLKDRKHNKYASNLHELNLLLQSIDKNTLVIIDGLDHIERVFSYKQAELTLSDIAIIEAINNLQFSNKVRILLVSQPIEELNKLSDYTTLTIPKWTKAEVLEYFLKNHIVDKELQERKQLHELLTEKSNGNPLYLNYIVEEIKNIQNITIQQIDSLPAYSYNLKSYYQYIIDKLNYDTTVPQILSGANFSLTKSELKEITHQGNIVENSLNALKPILNEKFTNGGFIIYHESFRRFILEKLENEKVNIERAIFKPIIDWFEEKGFFPFIKAYRFYFQLLYDTGKFDRILEYLTPEFITKSIYNGHSFDAVKSNYYFFAKSALKKMDFSNIILVNELNKVLSSTEDTFYDEFHLYFSALGYLKGFKSVSDYLVFEEKPTLPLLAGLEACYLCSQNNEPAPWGLYYEYFDNQKELSINEFKFYIRGLLVFKETESLVEIASKVFDKHKTYIPVYAKELNEYNDRDYLQELHEYAEIFAKICNYNIPIETSEKGLLALANEVLEFKNIFDKEVLIIELFFNQIDVNIENEKLIEDVLTLFKAKNWFYNWIIFYIKIKKTLSKEDKDFSMLQDAFKFLIYDTEPFKGKPRTSDLYSLEKYLYNSFAEGIKYLKNETEWKEIIKILVKLSNETTTEVKKSIGGPLSTDKLFQLLDEYSNNINRSLIINEFVILIEEKETYHLHSYLTEYCFRLTKLYSIENKMDKADEYFQKGLKLSIGYTFRRDRTAEDLLYSVVNYSKINIASGIEYVKKIKSLINAVTDHTDGKETKWFPIEWYQKYFKINQKEASLYLLSQIKGTYYWIHEEQLQDLIIFSNGEINHTVEAFIFLSFPVDTDEAFLSYGLNLVEKLKAENHVLSDILIQNIIEKSMNRRSDGFGILFIDKFNSILNGYKLDEFNIIKSLPKEKIYPSEKNIIEIIEVNSIPRKQFSEMSVSNMVEYFSENKIKETELISLCYYFDSLSDLTPEIEILIETIIKKHEEYPKNKSIDLSIIFDLSNDISAYYWVTQFTCEHDGSYKNFQNTKAFKKAFSINKDIAVKSLINQIEKFTLLGSYNRAVSSGLINNLIEVNYDTEIIEKMWQNLYNATNFRLPVQEEIDWNEILKDELDLNIEDIFICLLFTRFNSNTTERHHWTLSGLCYLYENHPDKMIKPTKWFLQNKEVFLTSNIIIILEILLDISYHSKEYSKNFEKELNHIVPSKYFLINFLIAKLLNKHIPSTSSTNKLYCPANKKDINSFASINYRNEIIYKKGFEFENVVGKYKSSFGKEYGKSFQFLGNVSVEQFVKNIYPANYQLELINTELYREFENYPYQSDLYDFLKIDYKTIVAQNQSYIKRPNLPKPSQIEGGWTKTEISKKNDWIRIGYYECELFGERYSESKNYIAFEGVVFNSNLNDDFPFSTYSLYPIHLWEEIDMSGIDEFLCVLLIQQRDTLEDYKILWLNTEIISKLKLENEKYTNGLAAKNELGEIVLKFNRWSSNYVGNGDITGISDEIPRLEGAELMCRKDYFDKICVFFEPQIPYLYRLNIK